MDHSFDCGDISKVAGASSSLTDPREQDAPATLCEYFNPLSEIDIRTGGNLPHWNQGSVWYFITFRLADALHRAVLEDIQYQREQWRRAHDLQDLSREELAEYHRLFSERYENLLDAGSGSCALRDPKNAEIVHGALRFFDGQRYVLDEYVVMPNHVHVLVKPLAGHGLVEILHSWKSFTAKRINLRLRQTGPLWQHESYDHIVRNESALHAIRHYIRENPTKVGGASCSPPGKREQDAPATLQNMTILYFAQARRLAGIASESLAVTSPVTADALWSAILVRHPELSPLRSVTRLARNGEFAGAETLFAPGDEVALIPPVSGG